MPHDCWQLRSLPVFDHSGSGSFLEGTWSQQGVKLISEVERSFGKGTAVEPGTMKYETAREAIRDGLPGCGQALTPVHVRKAPQHRTLPLRPANSGTWHNMSNEKVIPRANFSSSRISILLLTAHSEISERAGSSKCGLSVYEKIKPNEPFFLEIIDKIAAMHCFWLSFAAIDVCICSDPFAATMCSMLMGLTCRCGTSHFVETRHTGKFAFVKASDDFRSHNLASDVECAICETPSTG